MDAVRCDHRLHLAVSVSRDLGLFWVCDLPSRSRQGELDGGNAIRDQSDRERDFHTDSVRMAEFAIGGFGHRCGVGDDSLVHGGHLAALQMGFHRASPVFDLGVDRDGVAAIDHVLELGPVIEEGQASPEVIGDA